MTYLKCAYCKHIVGEDELETKRDYRGEFWGAPAYETISVCPYCGGDDFDEYTEDEEGDGNDSGTD